MLIRNGKCSDARDFANLVLLSGPSFLPAVFGPEAADLMTNLFWQDRNLFSRELVRFGVVNGKNAGMLLGYTGQQRNDILLHTGRLLIDYFRGRFIGVLPRLLKANRLLTSPGKDEFYVSSLAVYPEFRGKGVATALLLDAEKRAASAEAKRLVLDVEVENSAALNLYRKLGFEDARPPRSTRIGGTEFHFVKMVKTVNPRV